MISFFVSKKWLGQPSLRFPIKNVLYCACARKGHRSNLRRMTMAHDIFFLNRPFGLSGLMVRDKLNWTQVSRWDFQDKETRTSPARLSFVWKVPLGNLPLSVIYSVPCDWIVQKSYFGQLQIIDQ